MRFCSDDQGLYSTLVTSEVFSAVISCKILTTSYLYYRQIYLQDQSIQNKNIQFNFEKCFTAGIDCLLFVQRRGSDSMMRSRMSFQPTPSSLKTYSLKTNNNHLVRIEIHPPRDGSLRLGVTFTGTLDFQAPGLFSAPKPEAVVCHQVCVTAYRK